MQVHRWRTKTEVLIQVTSVKSAVTCQASSGSCWEELGPGPRGHFLNQFPCDWDYQQVRRAASRELQIPDTCVLRRTAGLLSSIRPLQGGWVTRPLPPPLPPLFLPLTSFCSFSMVLSRCHRSFSISPFSLLNCSFCLVSSFSFSDNCLCSWVAWLRFLCRWQGKDSAITYLPGQPQKQVAEGVSQPHHKAIRPATSVITKRIKIKPSQRHKDIVGSAIQGPRRKVDLTRDMRRNEGQTKDALQKYSKRPRLLQVVIQDSVQKPDRTHAWKLR